MLLLLPPNKLRIPDTSDPSPPMLPNPPPKALEIPPEAVCFSKLLHTFPDTEVLAFVLEGVPKLIPVGRSFALIETALLSPEFPIVSVFSVLACEGFTNWAVESNLLILRPSSLTRDSWLIRPDKLFLEFATFILHSPRPL